MEQRVLVDSPDSHQRALISLLVSNWPELIKGAAQQRIMSLIGSVTQRNVVLGLENKGDRISL